MRTRSFSDAGTSVNTSTSLIIDMLQSVNNTRHTANKTVLQWPLSTLPPHSSLTCCSLSTTQDTQLTRPCYNDFCQHFHLTHHWHAAVNNTRHAANKTVLQWLLSTLPPHSSLTCCSLSTTQDTQLTRPCYNHQVSLHTLNYTPGRGCGYLLDQV